MTMSDPLTDLALLRRFEPILRFTQGEQFFPMSVDPYVRACTLWVQRPDEVAVQLAPAGELDLTRLAYPYPDEFGAIHYLRLVEPYGAARQMVAHPQSRHPFTPVWAGWPAPAMVRLVDALFRLRCWPVAGCRGHRRRRSACLSTAGRSGRGFRHYGRVIRQSHWLVLQHWFFYLFNNWRSGFLAPTTTRPIQRCVSIWPRMRECSAIRPEWVAFASHDYVGDDLRLCWDDPEITK
jgi:hypothetical protein